MAVVNVNISKTFIWTSIVVCWRLAKSGMHRPLIRQTKKYCTLLVVIHERLSVAKKINKFYFSYFWNFFTGMFLTREWHHFFCTMCLIAILLLSWSFQDVQLNSSDPRPGRILQSKNFKGNECARFLHMVAIILAVQSPSCCCGALSRISATHTVVS